MSLPLNDPTNPLYGLEPAEQCRVLEKQGVAIPPERLFSLSGSYDNQALKKAYRQLSLRLHPDKNAEVKEAHTAFQLLTDAYNYLEFKLDSHGDVSSGMKNNPYYKAYAEIAPVFKYDLEKMEYQYKSLLKIITEAKTITPQQITLVKYYISLNKSLLEYAVYFDDIRMLAVQYFDLPFLSWLLAQGTVFKFESLWERMFKHALSAGKPNIFKLLCDSLGQERLRTISTTLDTNDYFQSCRTAPLGTYLFYKAIACNQLESLRYLLEDMGYRQHLHEGAANYSTVHSNEPCSFSLAPLYIYLREHQLLCWSRADNFLRYAVMHEDMLLWHHIMDNDVAKINLTDLLSCYYEALERHPDNSELVGRLLTTIKARIVSFSELRELISHHFDCMMWSTNLIHTS